MLELFVFPHHSDALFLDLALEGAARRAVEAALPALRAAAAAHNTAGGGIAEFMPAADAAALQQLLRVAALAAQSAALSAPGDAELALAVKGIKVLVGTYIALA